MSFLHLWFPDRPPDVTRELEQKPGELLDKQGLTEKPSPYVDDEIAAATRRLLSNYK